MNEQTWHPRDLLRSGLYLAGTVVLLVSLVALITASGCGGGGGGGITGLPLSQVAQNGTITGRVIASDLIIASRLAATTQSVKAGTQAIANADVWLEQLPTHRTRTDSEGRFTFTGVPLGSYRVVAKLFSPLTQETYKIRSPNFSLGEDVNAHDAGDLGVKKAVNQVSGILRDNGGRPIPFAKMLLWGETFTTDSNGYFITPPLPQEETGAEVTVVSSSEVKETAFPIEYIPGTIPVIEVAVPTQSQMQQAPVAKIAASAIQVTPNELVTLSADADDPLGATRDRLGFTWSATAGQLASGSYPWTVRWTAPSYDTVATVSVVVVNGSGLSGTARVPITVGAGGVNHRPAISSVTTSGTSGDIAITYGVTDADNDPVSIAVYYSLDDGANWTQTTHFTGTTTGITPGTGKSLTWHSAVDAPAATSTARIKLIPSDVGGNGTAGISASFAIDNRSIAVVSNVMTTVGTSTVVITYDLAEPSNQACSIAVAYSLNGGTTFTQTTNLTGTTTGVTPGTSKTLTWNWKQDVIPPQSNMVLRLTPDNGVLQGTPGISSAFSLGTANNAPVVSSVIASGSSGNIEIEYTLADADGDSCSIGVEYSINGGANWTTTTNVTGSSNVQPGSGKILVWSSSADITTN